MKQLLRLNLLIGFVLVAISTKAQTNIATNNDYTGQWGNNSSWQGGINPGYLDLYKGNIDVYGYINVGNATTSQSMTFKGGGTFPSYSLTVHDTLVIYGNVDFANQSMQLDVPPNGVLIIMGNYTGTNKITISNGGTFIVAGDMTASGSKADYSGSGDVYVLGTASNINHLPTTGNDGGRLQSANSTLYDFVTGGGTSPLPIELSSFSGALQNGAIELQWATLTEINFSHFEIEHSTDGMAFNQIGEVKGVGESKQEQHYSFTHAAPDYGFNYYRLKLVDNDGTFEYSSIIAIKNSVKSQVSVYPNPIKADGVFQVTMPAGLKGGMQSIKLLDVSGKVIWTKTDSLSNSNSLEIPSTYGKGTYFIQLLYNNELVTLKAIKR